MDNPINILVRIETHICQHGCQESVLGTFHRRYRDCLPFQITDRADLISAEKLKAADVHARQDCDRLARVQPRSARRDEDETDVHITGCQERLGSTAYRLDILYIGEAFLLKQFFGEVLRRQANAGNEIGLTSLSSFRPTHLPVLVQQA